MPFSGALTISKVELATGVETVLFADAAVALPAGPGAARWLTVDASIDGHDFVLRGTVTDAAQGGAAVTEAFFPLLPPANWTTLPPAPSVSFSVADAPNADGASINVTVATDKTAAFVTLTTLASGRFSDNAFLLLPGARTLTFEAWGSVHEAAGVLRSTLRLDHLADAVQGLLAAAGVRAV